MSFVVLCDSLIVALVQDLKIEKYTHPLLSILLENLLS
jgi:hypothetical protein